MSDFLFYEQDKTERPLRQKLHDNLACLLPVPLVSPFEKSVGKSDGIFGIKTGLLRDRCKSEKCQFR